MHITSGLSDVEWFQRSVEEAHRDPVGLWQMVKAGRNGFGLSDVLLDEFVKDFVIAMLKGGAVPVIGDKLAPFGWSPTVQYGTNPEDVANALIKDWKNSGVDPDVDGVWFAAESVWK